MSTSFDLSNQAPIPLNSGQPTKQEDGPRGTGTPIDEYARYVAMAAIAAFIGSAGYLLYGLFSGSWCNPAYDGLGHAGRAQQLANIGLFTTIMDYSSWIGVVALLLVAFRDESMGYILLTVGGIFFWGCPYLYGQFFSGSQHLPSPATTQALASLQAMVWPLGIPGVILVLVDFIKRFRDASENAAIQRANVRYGGHVVEQKATTQKQVFLGRCWELSYCRDNVRPKCPIFLDKKGPCWWRKRGCMCDERIVLQAIVANDWKEKAEAADQHYRQRGDANYSLTAGSGPILTEAAKRDRCRGCVIYNEHQRQKYNALVAAVLVATPILIWLNLGVVQDTVAKLSTRAVHITKSLALPTDSTPGDKPAVTSDRETPTAAVGDADTSGAPSPFFQWSIIVIATMVILSQVLKFIEYWCFKIKI